MSEFNQRPFLISGKASVSVGKSDYSVYLDINNKSRLEGLYFECSNEDELFVHFSTLASQLERAPLSKVKSITREWESENQSFFQNKILNLPLYLFNLAYSDYLGSNYTFESLGKREKEQLICRCFGVSQSQVNELVKIDPQTSLLSVADKLKATIGCGSCRSDIESAISKAKNLEIIEDNSFETLSLKFDQDGNRIRPLGLAPSEVVLKIDALKTKWMKEQELEKFQIDIVAISGHTLEFKVVPDNNGKYLLDTFSEYVASKLGLTFRFDQLI